MMKQQMEMALPAHDHTFFKLLTIYVKNEFQHEEHWKFSFHGYIELITRYKNLQEHEYEEAWALAKELNAWAEYFSELTNFVQKAYLDSQTIKIQEQAKVSIAANEKVVAKGDRYANKDPLVVQARKRRNLLKAFYEELQSKTRFLERCYYHCKMTYEMNIKQMELHAFVQNNNKEGRLA